MRNQQPRGRLAGLFGIGLNLCVAAGVGFAYLKIFAPYIA
jgi:hypothetical protein